MINVLSLFDGMSCGQIALNNLGIVPNNYYASEIDKKAINVTLDNFPNTKQIGDVTKLDDNFLKTLPKIDLLIGGSPCTNLSFSGNRSGLSTVDKIEILTLKQYLNLKKNGFRFNGQSYLFWEYVRILNWIKKYNNPNVKFLLENVNMEKKWKTLFSSILNTECINIDSKLLSAQKRNRLYWTNIENVKQPEDLNIKLKDIIDNNESNYTYWNDVSMQKYHNKEYVRKDYYRVEDLNGKVQCLMAQFGQNHPKVWHNNRFRKLTVLEFERLQTVPDNYTKVSNKTNAYKMLGNGWTVDVIVHIFKNLKNNL